jgi:hypothetical protein
VNVLKPHLKLTIATLLARGVGQHEIGRLTGVSRTTIRAYQRSMTVAESNCHTPATGSGGIVRGPGGNVITATRTHLIGNAGSTRR